MARGLGCRPLRGLIWLVRAGELTLGDICVCLDYPGVCFSLSGCVPVVVPVGATSVDMVSFSSIVSPVHVYTTL